MKVFVAIDRVHATDSYIEIPVLSTGTCSEFRTFLSLKNGAARSDPGMLAAARV